MVGIAGCAANAVTEVKEKGIGNRIEYAGARVVNRAKTNARDCFITTAGLAASAAAAGAVAKSPALQNAVKNLGNTIKNSSISKSLGSKLKLVSDKVKPGFENFAKKLNALPPAAKAVFSIGAIATGIAALHSHNKGIKNAGRIEQKYNDMAALNKQIS